MIVIPMAGSSSRFLAAGYSIPKYMLPLHDRPLFDWTVMSFKRMFHSAEFLFIARDIHGTASFIEHRLSILGLKHSRVVILDGPTNGQAETVEKGLKLASVAVSEPLVIFNIDTIRPRFEILSSQLSSNWLEVFRATGENWSFVVPHPQISGTVARCVEKQRVSDLCSTGVYVFQSSEHFLAALDAERLTPSSSEFFVAPLYNHLISAGKRVTWREVEASQVILSGVPQEYEALGASGLLQALDW